MGQVFTTRPFKNIGLDLQSVAAETALNFLVFEVE
jgi:hypothetical protein